MAFLVIYRISDEFPKLMESNDDGLAALAQRKLALSYVVKGSSSYFKSGSDCEINVGNLKTV